MDNLAQMYIILSVNMKNAPLRSRNVTVFFNGIFYSSNFNFRSVYPEEITWNKKQFAQQFVAVVFLVIRVLGTT